MARRKRQPAVPRPESIREPAGRVLAALEVPPCRCRLRMAFVRVRVPDPTPADPGRCRTLKVRYLPRCRHVGLADHEVPFEVWAELLRRLDPSGYAERPAPEPCLSPELLYQRCRVALYARRRAAGQSLFHPLDAHQWGLEALGVVASKTGEEGEMVRA